MSLPFSPNLLILPLEVYFLFTTLQEVEWGGQEAGGKAVYKPGQEGSGIVILHV